MSTTSGAVFQHYFSLLDKKHTLFSSILYHQPVVLSISFGLVNLPTFFAWDQGPFFVRLTQSHSNCRHALRSWPIYIPDLLKHHCMRTNAELCTIVFTAEEKSDLETNTGGRYPPATAVFRSWCQQILYYKSYQLNVLTSRTDLLKINSLKCWKKIALNFNWITVE